MTTKTTERLAVRVRRIASGNGDASVALSVYCSGRDESVSLQECEVCPHCRGVTLDSTGRDSFLMCDRPTAHRPAVWERVLKKMLPVVATQACIGDVMTRDVVCVMRDVSVESLTALLLERGISGAPVVDEHGHPIGMVSKTDLLRERFERGDDGEEDSEAVRVRLRGVDVELGPGFHAERIAHATVGEVMMPIAFTLEERAPLAYAAALMSTEGVHRLPVVGSDGKVVGILSALDVLRWLAEESGNLARS